MAHYPADTFQEATEIAIEASNQLHGVINGDANAEVTVEDGSKIPSVRKAMVDSLYFKPPIAWAQGEYEDTYNQLREFVDGDVRTWWFAKGATVSTPVLMTTNPATDVNWTLWSAVTLNAATYKTQKRLAAEAGLNMVGSFLLGATVTTTDDVVFYETDGKYYGWGGTLPKIIPAGSTPATSGGIGAGAWVDRTQETIRSELNILVKRIDNVAAMVADSALTIGDLVETTSYHSGWGTTAYGVTGGNTYLVVAGGTGTADGGSYINLANGLQAQALFDSDVIYFEQFGAKGDALNDDTLHIQAAIDFVSPYKWMGSVTATKASFSGAKFKLSGRGKFRITSRIRINPFVVISGASGGGWFGGDVGLKLYADYDDTLGYVIDTSTFNASGVRVDGLTSTGSDFDRGLIVGCPGWELRNVRVSVAAGRKIKGIINRNAAGQSKITCCDFTGGYIGVANSATWAGKVTDNHIISIMIGICNYHSITTDEQKNNYITVRGTKPTALEFQYPTWSSSDPLYYSQVGVYSYFSNPHIDGNIIEYAEVAYMGVAGEVTVGLSYLENISKVLYATQNCDMSIRLGQTRCPAAKMFHCLRTDVFKTFMYVDASAFNEFYTTGGLVSLKSTDAYIYLSNAESVFNNPTCPFDQQVTLMDKVNDIYVSGSGSDAAWGYSSSYPVLTLQEAIDRTIKGADNIIHVIGSVGTKYTYSSGGNTTNKKVTPRKISLIGSSSAVINVGVSFSNEFHVLPRGIVDIYASDLSIVFSAGADTLFRNFINVDGNVSINLESVIFSGGTLFGIHGLTNGAAGHVTLTTKNSTLGCYLAKGHQSGRLSWIENSFNTSVAGGTVGDEVGYKVHSSLYP